ncbi:MAG: hypothetical protein ABII80_02800 [bacterium]
MKVNKVKVFVVLIGVFLVGLLFGLSVNARQLINKPFSLNIFAKSCEYNGNTYKQGEGFEDVDGCNSCSCQNGNVSCTVMACEENYMPDEDPIDPYASDLSCYYNGVTYQAGEGFQDTDSCNWCSCDDGEVACTTMACL